MPFCGAPHVLPQLMHMTGLQKLRLHHIEIWAAYSPRSNAAADNGNHTSSCSSCETVDAEICSV